MKTKFVLCVFPNIILIMTYMYVCYQTAKSVSELDVAQNIKMLADIFFKATKMVRKIAKTEKRE